MASNPNDPANAMREAGDAFRKAGSQAAENGHQISMKMIEQAERNTREVFAAMRQISQAGNVADVVKLQGDFVREQSERAMQQARELGELMAQIGRDAVGTMGNPFGRKG